MTTFKGAVVNCVPGAGPRGLARWRKESASAMLGRIIQENLLVDELQDGVVLSCSITL